MTPKERAHRAWVVVRDSWRDSEHGLESGPINDVAEEWIERAIRRAMSDAYEHCARHAATIAMQRVSDDDLDDQYRAGAVATAQEIAGVFRLWQTKEWEELGL
jgi:hypothetical protein